MVLSSLECIAYSTKTECILVKSTFLKRFNFNKKKRRMKAKKMYGSIYKSIITYTFLLYRASFNLRVVFKQLLKVMGCSI